MTYDLRANIIDRYPSNNAQNRFRNFTQYEFSNGHALYHENVPTRLPSLDEVTEAFTRQDAKVYHILDRVRNANGETTHIVYSPIVQKAEKARFGKTLLKLFRIIK